jgi:hypothetical protein
MDFDGTFNLTTALTILFSTFIFVILVVAALASTAIKNQSKKIA